MRTAAGWEPPCTSLPPRTTGMPWVYPRFASVEGDEIPALALQPMVEWDPAEGSWASQASRWTRCRRRS